MSSKRLIKTISILIACCTPGINTFAHNGSVAYAYPLGNIKIDGDLADWPANATKYTMTWVPSDMRPKDDSDFSGFFQLGYRLNNRWDLIGYYDSYRFSQSDSVRVTAIRFFPGTNFSLIQPRSSMDAFGVKLQYTF